MVSAPISSLAPAAAFIPPPFSAFPPVMVNFESSTITSELTVNALPFEFALKISLLLFEFAPERVRLRALYEPLPSALSSAGITCLPTSPSIYIV